MNNITGSSWLMLSKSVRLYVLKAEIIYLASIIPRQTKFS